MPAVSRHTARVILGAVAGCEIHPETASLASMDPATARRMTRFASSAMTRVPVAHHDKYSGISTGDSHQARWRARRPAGRPQASSGLDGPTMPIPFNKFVDTFPGECCLPAGHARHGEAGELVF